MTLSDWLVLPRSALLACLQDVAVKRNQMPPSHFFWLFPVLHSKGGQGSQIAPSDRIAQTFYARLLASGASSCPLPVAAPANMRKQTRMDAPPAYWVKVSEAIFVPSGKTAEHVTASLLDSVVECLLRCGVPLVDAPVQVLESLVHSREAAASNGSKALTILTPAWLRQRLRSEGGMKSHTLNKTPAADIFAQLTPADVADLLEFAVSDGNIADLRGVPLLMCEDESTVHSFSDSGTSVFFPQNSLERRLFPSKDGKKLVLASKFEARPLLWAKFKKMAIAAEAEGKPETVATKPPKPPAVSMSAAFQCKFVTFALLVKALQMLLPRTWNNPVPRIPLSDYSEWVEDWLQAMWKWLDEKEVELFQMVHWPLIPSLLSDSVDLVRVPEPHKLVLFSAVRTSPLPTAVGYPPPPPPPEAPETPGSPTNGRAETEIVCKGAEDDSDVSKLSLVQQMLQTRLHCKAIHEPNWLSQHHEKQLRSCVHASSAEGLLRSMHFASKILCSCQRQPITVAQALHMSLSSELSPKAVRALLFIATRVQRESCSCKMDGSQGSWKSRCEVLRGLPILCRFNQSQQHISLSGTEESQDFWVLPETCPQVVAALRAAQVDLPTCAEIPDQVLGTMSSSETMAVSSLLRELALPRLKWSDLLLKHVFPWAIEKSKVAGSTCQGLMRAIVYHWRDMELAGNGLCTEAVQHISFISTLGGNMVSAAEALDPAVDKLLALYGPGDIKGPFPEARWQSSECRAVLQYRSELSYRELSERLGFLHHLEVERREDETKAQQKLPAEILAVAHALLRYVCETVGPTMADAFQGEPEEDKPAEQDAGGLWQMFSGIMGETAKTAKEARAAQQLQRLSEDELMSIQSKLRRCFWLPPMNAPSGWPTEAPWKGSLCGLCSAEEAQENQSQMRFDKIFDSLHREYHSW